MPGRSSKIKPDGWTRWTKTGEKAAHYLFNAQEKVVDKITASINSVCASEMPMAQDGGELISSLEAILGGDRYSQMVETLLNDSYGIEE